jgi:hypothetical protein
MYTNWRYAEGAATDEIGARLSKAPVAIPLDATQRQVRRKVPAERNGSRFEWRQHSHKSILRQL